MADPYVLDFELEIGYTRKLELWGRHSAEGGCSYLQFTELTVTYILVALSRIRWRSWKLHLVEAVAMGSLADWFQNETGEMIPLIAQGPDLDYAEILSAT